MNKDKIKRLLWEEDFAKKIQNQLVENAVGGYRLDYLGCSPTDTETLKKAEIQIQNNTFHALIKMLTAYMINFLFDKTIDEVIKIFEENPELTTTKKCGEDEQVVCLL